MKLAQFSKQCLPLETYNSALSSKTNIEFFFVFLNFSYYLSCHFHKKINWGLLTEFQAIKSSVPSILSSALDAAHLLV